MSRRGYYGRSQEHALNARGIRTSLNSKGLGKNSHIYHQYEYEKSFSLNAYWLSVWQFALEEYIKKMEESDWPRENDIEELKWQLELLRKAEIKNREIPGTEIVIMSKREIPHKEYQEYLRNKKED